MSKNENRQNLVCDISKKPYWISAYKPEDKMKMIELFKGLLITGPVQFFEVAHITF